MSVDPTAGHCSLIPPTARLWPYAKGSYFALPSSLKRWACLPLQESGVLVRGGAKGNRPTKLRKTRLSRGAKRRIPFRRPVGLQQLGLGDQSVAVLNQQISAV